MPIDSPENRSGRRPPTIVITGGTSGFGRALAGELVGLGAQLVVAGRAADRAADVARELGAERVLGVGCDVRDEGDTDRLWSAAIDRFGQVDHWINNAGVGHSRHRLDEFPFDEARAVVETNLIGALLGARRALQGMLAQSGGWIWLTEGLGSDGRALPGTGVYGASKAGATHAYEVLARECRQTPVRIGFIRPGIMPTGLTREDSADGQEVPLFARLLGDRPEAVAGGLAPRIIAARRSGQRLTWLTPGRVARHLVTRTFTRRSGFRPGSTSAAAD